MNAVTVAHPANEILAAFGQGKLDETAMVSVATHLESCSLCRNKVASSPADTFQGKVKQAKEADAPTQTIVGFEETLNSIKPVAKEASGLPPELANHPKYLINKELGRGGMGVVYQAIDKHVDRPVVIKVMNPKLLCDPAAQERFLQEAKSAAKLNHPNIAQLYQLDKVGDLHLLVFEYVDGVNLEQFVRMKGVPAIHLTAIFIRQAALGLQHAFEQGVLHRDIKPNNMMLTRKGQVKIIDFGLGKVAQAAQASSSGLTSQNAVMGTLDYMSPEQAKSAKTADIRSDLYSLGCTLFYLLTGRAPFVRDTQVEIIVAHQSDTPPPLSQFRTDVPADLEAIVMKLLAKQPQVRFQKPVELAQALVPFLKPMVMAKLVSPPIEPGKVVVSKASTLRGMATKSELNIKSELKQSLPGWLRDFSWKSWQGITAITLAGLLAMALVVGIIISVKTKDGTLIIENVPEDAYVLINGERVTVHVKGENEAWIITQKPGHKKVEVRKGDEVLFSCKEVELASGGKETIKVKLAEEMLKPGGGPDIPGGGVPDGGITESVGGGGTLPGGGEKKTPDGQILPPKDNDIKWITIFEDGTFRGGWRRQKGAGGTDLRIEDGKVVADGNGDKFFTFYKPVRNFSLRAEIFIAAGSKAVMFFRSAHIGDRQRGYSIGLGSKGNGLAGMGNVFKWAFMSGNVNLQELALKEKSISDKWFTVEVVVNEKRVIVKADGEILTEGSITDTEYSSGDVGFSIHNLTDASVKQNVQFRKIQIVELNEVSGVASPPGGTSSNIGEQPGGIPTNKPSDGFTSLFNGKDLTGWHIPSQNKGTWKVMGGHLHGTGAEGVLGVAMIASEKTDFRDFHLRLRVKNNDGNSKQIVFRATTDIDTQNSYGVSLGGTITGAGTPIAIGSINKAVNRPHVGRITWDVPAKSVDLPIGKWYTLQIRAVGGKITTFINDEKVAEYEDRGSYYQSGQIRLIARAKTTIEYESIEIQELTHASGGLPGGNLPTGGLTGSKPQTDGGALPPGGLGSSIGGQSGGIPDTKPSDGFTSLFNGKDLTGWKNFYPDKVASGGGWTVQNGVLSSKSDSRGEDGILTDKEYTNFHLRAEISHAGVKNKHLFFRARYDGTNQFSYQVSPTGGLDWGNDKTVFLGKMAVMPGSSPFEGNSSIVTAVKEPANSPIETNTWHTVELVVEDYRFRFYVDGKLESEFTDPNRRFAKGAIGLRLNAESGGGLKIRKLEIKELPIKVSDKNISKPMNDSLLVNSQWKGPMTRTIRSGTTQVNVTLSITERNGDRFKGIFTTANNTREVNGYIQSNGTIGWYAKDVRIIQGHEGHDHLGKISGNTITLNYSGVTKDGTNQAVKGTVALRLQK